MQTASHSKTLVELLDCSCQNVVLSWGYQLDPISVMGLDANIKYVGMCYNAIMRMRQFEPCDGIVNSHDSGDDERWRICGCGGTGLAFTILEMGLKI